MKKYRISNLLLLGGIIIFFGFTADKYHQQSVYSNSLTGKVRATKKPDAFFPGCFCHSQDKQPSLLVTTWISGKDTLSPGETAVYTIYTTKDSLLAAGFNLASFFGTLDTLESETRLEDGELTHTFPRFSNGSDTISWTFSYTAPNQVGFDTLYANSCCVDTSYDPNGDFWSYAPNFLITIAPKSSTTALVQQPTLFSLNQNYPNPFNPSTVITYSLQSMGDVRLEVYDISGKKITTLVNERKGAGLYSVTLNANTYNLTSGVYFYRLQAGNSTETKKLLFLK